MQMMKPMLDMIMGSIMAMTSRWFENYNSNGMYPKQKIKVKVILNWTISLQAWVELGIWHVPLKKYILVRHHRKNVQINHNDRCAHFFLSIMMQYDCRGLICWL